ncbi:MAG: tetratricopeptide repeat protein [Bacteroidota bacterium]
MLNYKFIVYILVFLGTKSFAISEPDSLLQLVNSSKGKQKADALNAIAFYYCYNEPNKAKHYAFTSLKVCERENYSEGWGKAYIRLGIAYDVSGNYDSSVYCYNQALKKYTSPKGIGAAYNNLGLIEWKHSKLKDAIGYFYKAMPYFQQIEDKNYLANLYNNIGLIFQETKDHRKALSFFLKAVELYRLIEDMDNMGGTYTNISNAYSWMGKKDSALYYINQSIDYNSKANNIYGLSIAYIDLGSLLVSKDYKRYDEALIYYHKSLALKKQMNEEEGIVFIYIDIADIHHRKQQNDSFIFYSYKALEISKKNNFLGRQKKLYQNFAEFYAEQKNADSVYTYLNLFNTLKDSIYNKEFNSALADAETKYETKEKELTIQLQDNQISKKNYYIVALLFSLISIALIFILLYHRYKARQKNKLQAEIIHQQDLATKAVLEAEENERKRVATDLHDSVGQILSAVKINLSAMETSIAKDNLPKYDNIMNMVDNACKEVRAIAHNMMPNSLLKNGLVSAIKEFINQINSDVLKITLNTSGLSNRLESNTEMVLYRVVQESVNNVIKHAQASTLEIQIILDEEGVSLTIEDNGKGFDTTKQSEGIGLQNLRSRITFLKGEIDIQSAPGKGTLIAIFIGSNHQPA